VHPSGPRFNHHSHEFVGVEVAAKAGFGIGHEGHQPIAGGTFLRILCILDLVCPQKGIINATHEGGDAFYGV
jgi:hypothetical protein